VLVGEGLAAHQVHPHPLALPASSQGKPSIPRERYGWRSIALDVLTLERLGGS
jgi:hypothetical protein